VSVFGSRACIGIVLRLITVRNLWKKFACVYEPKIWSLIIVVNKYKMFIVLDEFIDLLIDYISLCFGIHFSICRLNDRFIDELIN
jgi:hypothetical protein